MVVFHLAQHSNRRCSLRFYLLDFCLRLLFLAQTLINVVFLLRDLAQFNRICYFTNWGAHRSIKESRLYPEDIPPDLCTHILYAFANLHGQSLQPQLRNDINVDQGEKVSQRNI